MQIWKSYYMFVFIQKQYPEIFAFLILIILKLFVREVCKFLKKSRLIFNIIYCFWMFVNKLFAYLVCAYLKKQKMFYSEIINMAFSYEDVDIGRFSNLH